ncbi:MAG TPA: hypothetical protein VMW65_01520, partial [Chloroflexota bacterium]|nr:hypothetical protein [Chloroflexota bacterium]
AVIVSFCGTIVLLAYLMIAAIAAPRRLMALPDYALAIPLPWLIFIAAQGVMRRRSREFDRLKDAVDDALFALLGISKSDLAAQFRDRDFDSLTDDRHGPTWLTIGAFNESCSRRKDVDIEELRRLNADLQGTFSKPSISGRCFWTIPVGTCAIVGVIP